MRNKKAQLAIWVIISVVIVGGIILFLLVGRREIVPQVEEFQPQTFLGSCVQESVVEAVDKMLPQGGFLEPKNYKLYAGIKIEYLCYNGGNYLPCINHHPMLLNEIKSQIRNYTLPIVESCFESLKTELEKRNYEVEMGALNISESLAPERVSIRLNKEVTLTKDAETRRFEKFDIDIASPIYDLASIAIEIASQEAEFCSFSTTGYSLMYPNFEISSVKTSDSSKIYIIKDRKFGKVMNIAIRGCAIPAGI